MLGMLGFLLHTTLYFLGLLELVEARHTVKDCHLFWWETGAVTSDLLDCLWILGVLGCSAHTTLYFLGLLELVEARHTVKYCHFSWWGHGASAIDLLGFLGFWGCLGFCFTLPSSSWDSWYLWNY